MSDPIVTFDEAAVRGELRELVRQTVKDTLNALLEEADDLVKADRYERTAGREAYRVGRCERGLTTTSGRVTLRMPKPKSRGLSGVRMFTGGINRPPPWPAPSPRCSPTPPTGAARRTSTAARSRRRRSPRGPARRRCSRHPRPGAPRCRHGEGRCGGRIA